MLNISHTCKKLATFHREYIQDIFSFVTFFFFVNQPGNALEEKHSAEGDWRDQVADRLKKLKKLDGMFNFICCLNLFPVKLIKFRFC